MTLATAAENRPCCCNLFYAYLPEANLFVFSSDHTTQHAARMSANPWVGASIVLESKAIGMLQGLQLQGKVESVASMQPEQAKSMRSAYLKRFPYAAVMELTLWTFTPDFMKLTDNRLGFGKKLIWRDEQQ